VPRDCGGSNKPVFVENVYGGVKPLITSITII
jgi:hypothetical protein